MEETQAGRIAARLFFLGFFQSHTASRAAVEALHIWRNSRQAKLKVKSNSVLQNDMVLLVKACARVWQRNNANLSFGQPVVSNPTDWQMPPGINLSHWLEFRKHCEPTELMVFILTKVIGLPEEIVAQGLREAVGTIHFRTARAMKQLGAILLVEQRASL